MKYIAFDEKAEFEYLSSGKYVCKEPQLYPHRVLDSFVLLAGLSGEYDIICGGEEYTLRKNDIMLLPALSEHYGKVPCSADASHLWCHFRIKGDFEMLDSPLPLPLSLQADGKRVSLPVCITITGKSPDRCLVTIQSIINYAGDRELPQSLKVSICSLLAKAVCLELVSLTVPNIGKNAEKSSCGRTVNEVCEWIRLNLGSDITAFSTATHFGYNADYLSQLFRREKNMPLGKYINKTKLEHSRFLLVSTSEAVSRIAGLSGFNDEKHFMKAFKKAEGLTPTEYRKTFRNIHINSK